MASSYPLRLSAAFFVLFALVGIRGASAFELSVVGATNFSNPNIVSGGETATGYNAKAAFGGGLLLGFSMAPALELELGALYVGRHFHYPSASGEVDDSFYSYEVPMILRLTALEYVTAGAGGYVAGPAGDETYTLTPAGASGTATKNAASTNYKLDYGVVGSIGIKIPLNMAVSFLIDGRYYYGLGNASKIPGVTIKFRDAQALFGLNFEF